MALVPLVAASLWAWQRRSVDPDDDLALATSVARELLKDAARQSAPPRQGTVLWIAPSEALRECTDYAYYVRRTASSFDSHETRHLLVTDSPMVTSLNLQIQEAMVPAAVLSLSGELVVAWVDRSGEVRAADRITARMAQLTPDSVFVAIRNVTMGGVTP